MEAKAILALYEETTDWFASVNRSRGVIDALRWLFENPVLSSSAFAHAAGVPRRTALRWVEAFEDRGILREITTGSGRRAPILVFSKLLNIAEGREVF